MILEPAAFGELMSYLTDHFSAQAYDEGSSFLSAGLGAPYAGAAVTLVDDHAHPLAVGMPFDFEGTPTERVTLLDGGVGRRRRDRCATGRTSSAARTPATRSPSPTDRDGPQPRNLVHGARHARAPPS